MTRSLLLLLLLLTLAACNSPANKLASAQAVQPRPDGQLVNFAPEKIIALRSAIQQRDPAVLPAARKLMEYADQRLRDSLYTVMQKTTVPPSGDRHDYLSLAPYWWPDPAAADGLPWIRKDGLVNPATRDQNTDAQAKSRAYDNIEKLSAAAYFFGEKKYARRAIAQIDAWFLDPATRMNPNLNFGQGIPGRAEGRCFGIIEFNAILRVINGLDLLEFGGMLPDTTKRGMGEWLTEIVGWLQNSELGIEESNRHNNHGTWYDVQVVSILRYLGRNDEAREILERAKKKRIEAQIEPDGSQPYELARTKALSYSRMNLEGMTRLAWHGKQLGVDLWNYTSENGRSIPAAYRFLYPYAFNKRPWPYQQIGNIAKYKRELREMFYQMGSMLEVAELCALQPRSTKPVTDFNKLIFTCPQ